MPREDCTKSAAHHHLLGKSSDVLAEMEESDSDDESDESDVSDSFMEEAMQRITEEQEEGQGGGQAGTSAPDRRCNDTPTIETKMMRRSPSR